MNLKPSALYRQAESGSTQFDLNLNFSFKNTIHFGLGYIGNFSENTNFGPYPCINFNNIKTLLSQEFTMSEVSNYSSGTTEVTFKYEFKPKKSEKEKNEEEEEEEKEEEKSRFW